MKEKLRENISYRFKEMVILICHYTKTKRPYLRVYKLKHYDAWCSYKPKLNNFLITFNPDRMLEYTTQDIIEIAAHEVGHCRKKYWDRTKSEYKAQLFALKTIYKYFPEYFSLKFTKQIIKQNHRWYSKAFKQALKEFKIWKKSQ